ncbi:heterokaryon incompatibility protein-domain-containing protein [Phyllosticta capitalensis]|uniref:heterokaryon incompatibility protein-domain-containing protein n=1 Tax=Phyllosticta capitalensis TaxID=121624 RepID=UPI00312EB63F
MSQHAQLYRYRPLRSSATTRLVLIHPQSGTASGIAIELIEAFPNGSTKYDALSYTWGEEKPDKFVTCKGRRVAVTKNLLEALKRFRHPEKPVTMWIDQLCIDQDNMLERNRQVAMMGRIFACAEKVIVWLGEDMQVDSNGSRLDLKPGLRLAKQILDMLHDDPELKFDWDCLTNHRGGLPMAGNKAWQALAAVLRTRWWFRMWVIQEVVLSSRIEVVCGRSIFTWEEMGQIVGYLDCHEYRTSNHNSTTIAELPFTRINRMKKQHQREIQPALFDLIQACRDFGASDPRDKVYALLELGQHDTDPDYSKTTRDVFVEFAVSAVRAAQRTRSCCYHAIEDPYNLDCCSLGGSKARQRYERITTMLRCAGTTNQSQEDLPSWVPDWSVNLKLRPFDFGGCEQQQARHAYALGDLRVGQDASLSLPGRIYDTIKAAGSLQLDFRDVSDPKFERALIAQWYADCEAVAAENHLPYPTSGKTSHIVMMKILDRCGILAEDTMRPLSPPEQSSTKFNRPSLVEYHRRSSGNLIDDLANPPWVLPENHYESKMGLGVGRVLFTTTCGWMGLVPFGTREGDVIFVMLDCSIPFVLRPIEGGFTLLGECYVYGIMGEKDSFGEDIAVRDVIII